jgi:hypothetical protein
MTVLGDQHRLKEHCKYTEQRGPASRSRHPLFVRQDPCR